MISIMEERGKTDVSLVHNLEEGVVLAVDDDGRVIGAYGSDEEARLRLAAAGVEPCRSVDVDWNELRIKSARL